MSTPQPRAPRPSRVRGAVVVSGLLALAIAAVTAAVPHGPTTRTAVLVIGGGLAAVGAIGSGVRLMLLAARRHFGQGAVGSCHTAGCIGAGMVAAGTAVAAIAVGAAPTAMALAGLSVATGAFLPGLLMLPGAAQTLVGRLRRGLDGLSVGLCLLFAAWVLVIAPRGAIVSLGFWVALLTCCMLSVAVVAGLRAARTRPAALACAAAAGLAVLGLGGYAVALHVNATAWWLGGSLAVLAVGPAVAWQGVRHADTPEDPGPEPRETFAGYPLLAVPGAAALTVAVYHLATGGDFDRPSTLLGLAAIVGVALRETMGALDVSRYARRLAATEAQFRSLVAGSSDVIMVLDRDLIVRWQSPAAARQLGLSDQEVVGRHFQSMLHPEDALDAAARIAAVTTGDVGRIGRVELDRPVLIEARIRDGFGNWRETESAISDQRDVPEVGGLVVHVRDVTERKDMERMLHRLAYADQLTGLANRRQMFLSVVALRSMARSRGAVLLLSLDGFSAVSDARGYDIGDAVLVEVARRLRTAAGETDLLARLAGDEFAVVTEGGPVQAYALASRLLATLAEPIPLAGVTVYLATSIGLTDIISSVDGADVLRRAGLALRRAQQLGGGRIEWYDEAAEQDMLRRQALEQELPGALSRGELDVVYQPMMDLVQGRPLAVEALLRWRHPRLGTLLPCDIVPLAEQLGLIADIGGWVLRRSTRQLATWLREGRSLSVAVNISPRQMEGPGLAADVASVLALNGVPADRLVLELAEGQLGLDSGRELGNVDEQLVRLRALGVRTALDKFGTGPDSLAYLRRLPMDMVKIDRSFLDEIAEPRDDDVPIMDVLVGLGRRLGIEVVAQGIEAPNHLELVRAAGCRIGQGHLFAPPQPAEHVEAYLDGFGPRP